MNISSYMQFETSRDLPSSEAEKWNSRLYERELHFSALVEIRVIMTANYVQTNNLNNKGVVCLLSNNIFLDNNIYRKI